MSALYPPGCHGQPGDPPWYTTDAVKFLDEYVKSDTKILEFGAGLSTVWLSKRSNHIISIEHDPMWFEWVKSYAPNTDLRLILPPMEANVCDLFQDQSFDLITVDGNDDSRVACVRKSLRLLKSGGYLLFDNAERAFYRPIMNKSGHDYSEILELTDGWELYFTNQKPVSQHGNWYTVWWRKP